MAACTDFFVKDITTGGLDSGLCPSEESSDFLDCTALTEAENLFFLADIACSFSFCLITLREYYPRSLARVLNHQLRSRLLASLFAGLG